MQIKVRVRPKSSDPITLTAEIPNDLGDYSEDNVDGAVSDWLDDNAIKYKWYRVLDYKQPNK